MVDPDFAKAIGASEIETIEDLFAALAKDDADTVNQALRQLQADGTPFDLILTRADATSFRLLGRRGQGLHAGSDGKIARADMIWLSGPAAPRENA
jgi:hypothetical protein